MHYMLGLLAVLAGCGCHRSWKGDMVTGTVCVISF